jgi:hypothetical protein
MRRLLLAFALLLAAPGTAHAAAHATMTVRPSPVPGAQRLHFEYRPVHVSPGQNDIRIAENGLKPPGEGYVVAFRPNLTLADKRRTVPRVDQIHLHHGVWLGDDLQPRGTDARCGSSARGRTTGSRRAPCRGTWP